MTLNYIWIGFFIVAFVVALGKVIFLGDMEIFNQIMKGSFDDAANGFKIALGLTGVLSLWMGFMKIGEAGGVIHKFSKFANPLFSRLFPDIPKDHPSRGSILMNLSANILGLDNAATPAGLKAMQELQEINPDKKTASNPMIMFLVMNASGLTLIPISVMTMRAQMGAANPSDIFVPVMIATFVSTIAAVIAVCIKQRINIFDKVILGTFSAIIAILGLAIYAFKTLGQEAGQTYSTLFANFFLFSVIILFIGSAMKKKINVYDSFIEGAKEGFGTAVRIIPYLVAILVAVGMFRTSGALDFITDGIKYAVSAFSFDTRWVDGLPTALMKPLSGSGARGMMVEAMTNFGPDSFVGRLACVFQGSTDTTFFVVSVYYGSVAIRNSRYTIPYALFADLIGVITSIYVAYLFFG